MSQILSIEICNSPEEAPDYNKIPEFQAAQLIKAVVVRNGTKAGNDTVDFQFKDELGNKYAVMITGKNIKALASLLVTERN